METHLRILQFLQLPLILCYTSILTPVTYSANHGGLQTKTVSNSTTEVETCFQWSQQYLSLYHPDFKQLRLKCNSTSPGVFIVTDSSGFSLHLLDLTTPNYELQLFTELASLLLDTESPRVSSQALNALKLAWYWDAHARSNPAVFDKLKHPDGSHLPPKEQSLIFWKYRLMMYQHGGRKALWRSFHNNPDSIEKLKPDSMLTPEENLLLLELKNYKLSPVQNLEESQSWLQGIRTFQLCDPVGEHTKWLSIERLPDHITTTAVFETELQHRVDLIKSILPSINPLYHNTFQSLGVCYERLLQKDKTGYQAALKRYLQDLDFARQVADTIHKNKGIEEP